MKKSYNKCSTAPSTVQLATSRLSLCIMLSVAMPIAAQQQDPFGPAGNADIRFPNKAVSEIDSGEEAFLHVDQAFSLQLQESGGSPLLMWSIAPDYYLYHHSMKVFLVTSDGDKQEITGSFSDSPSLRKTDPYFGQVRVYYNRASMLGDRAFDQAFHSADTSLEVHYQSCAESGLCYPTQSRTLVYSK